MRPTWRTRVLFPPEVSGGFSAGGHRRRRSGLAVPQHRASAGEFCPHSAKSQRVDRPFPLHQARVADADAGSFGAAFDGRHGGRSVHDSRAREPHGGPLDVDCLVDACRRFLVSLGEPAISPDGAVVAVLFFLFLPFAVLASRSFEPDPLMIALFVGATWSIFRLRQTPSGCWLTTAVAVSASAISVKPVCVFPILLMFLSTGVFENGIARRSRASGRGSTSRSVCCPRSPITGTVCSSRIFCGGRPTPASYPACCWNGLFGAIGCGWPRR